MRRPRSWFLPALLAAVECAAWSQVVPSPSAIRKILLQKSADEKLFLEHRENEKPSLAKLLRLKDGQADSFCTEFDSVRVEYPKLEQSREHAVFIARSDACWYDFVVILEHRAAEWKLVQTFSLFSKYGHPQVTFPELVSPEVHEIMVDRDGLISGTGQWQYNTIIVKLFDGRPEVVFDASEESNLSVPAQSGGNTEQFQTSRFYLIASDRKKALKSILERQRTTVHSTSVARWRLFEWYPAVRRFRASPVPDEWAESALKERN